MKHITRTRMTQICTRIKNGEGHEEVAIKYGIPVERVVALTGIKVKKSKAAKSAAADEFSEE